MLKRRGRHSWPDALDLPLFIRHPDRMARDARERAARSRRIIRKNAFAICIIGGSFLGGAISAILLAFATNGGFYSIVPAAVVGFVGYRMVVMGSEQYMTSIQTYEDARTTF